MAGREPRLVIALVIVLTGGVVERTGATPAAPSANPYDRDPAGQCSYSVTPTSTSVPALATSRTITVVTGTACSWSAVSEVSWITILSGSGSGIGTVTYGVAAHTGTSPRTGTILIGGRTVTVTQGIDGCSYSLGATSASVPSTGGVGSLSVVTGTSCSWTAVSNAGWITVTGGATGTGLGVVSYSVAANTGGGTRTGTLTIAGRTFTVTQGTNSCTFSLGATSASVPSTGGVGSLSVVTGTSCSWTAASNAGWVTVTAGANGTGMGTVSYSVAANTGGGTRTGTLTIAGRTFTVTQAAGATPPGAPKNLRVVR
jgi:hypothetical protein